MDMKRKDHGISAVELNITKRTWTVFFALGCCAGLLGAAVPQNAAQSVPETPDGGRTLYNGIVLPKDWPPKINPDDRAPQHVPYLDATNIPAVIPIDVGRQLFVDDFLIARTEGLVRAFPKPQKHPANPLFWPQTPSELARDTDLKDADYPAEGVRMSHSPGCVMPGGGVWWDPTRKRFRMWYLPGWWGALSYAESKDGVRWERPAVGPGGDNILLPLDRQRFDTFGIWPDYTAADPYSNWYLSDSPGGFGQCAVYSSPDGIHWQFRKHSGFNGDCTTFFYNPFLGKWVWSLRASWRNRSRTYHAHQDFIAGSTWAFPKSEREKKNTADCFLWLACDNQDLTRTIAGRKRTNAQLYNVDAVPYESLMVGLFKILCGRDNGESARGGMPKTTTLHFAYSRDGFHFSRPDRTPAIADAGWGSGEWDSGYVGSCTSCFVINDDRLWFYYTGLRGDAGAVHPPTCCAENGMHWNGAIGVATLRRDGFAKMVADGLGELVTRPVRFSGTHLFVNADARFGRLAVEVLDGDDRPFAGFSAADCRLLEREDSTKREIVWKGGDLTAFAGKPVRFRFKLRVASLYSFWVSTKATGESGGYVAAGGPAFKGLRDL